MQQFHAWLGRHALGCMLFVGAFGNALPFALIAWGEQRVDSAVAAVMMGVMPIATVVMAHLAFADERLDPARAAGVALGSCGVVTLVGWQALSGVGGAVAHELAVLAGALCYGVSAIFTRRHVRVGGPAMAAGAVLAGAIMLVPLALAEAHPWRDGVDTGPLLALLSLGAFSTGLAALLYFHLIPAVGAGRFAQVNFLIPVLGVAWGALFLDERPGARLLLALGLILCGLALVTRRGRRAAATRPRTPRR